MTNQLTSAGLQVKAPLSLFRQTKIELLNQKNFDNAQR